jgi:hypothetical protein
MKRFIGVSLGGGKTDKTSVAIVEYYPEHNKIFLAKLFEKIKTEDEFSADLQIHEFLNQYKSEVEYVAFDAPLDYPKCLQCALPCPGYELCTEIEIKWMWNHFNEHRKDKRPKKLFTPYTERCVEMYIAHELEEPFNINHAMGANMAPMLARAQFISRRLDYEAIEVYPRLSVWRVGVELRVNKSHLRFYRHAVDGDNSRLNWLQALSNSKQFGSYFMYQQDVNLMVENLHSFEAFICALTAFFKYKDFTEKRPKGFPLNESWIEFPKIF